MSKGTSLAIMQEMMSTMEKLTGWVSEMDKRLARLEKIVALDHSVNASIDKAIATSGRAEVIAKVDAAVHGARR